MPLLPIQAVAGKIGVDEGKLREWVDSNRLTEHEQKIDSNAATELKRLDDEVGRIGVVQQRVDKLQTSLDQLRESIPVGDPKWYRNSTLFALGTSILVAFLALYVAAKQLGRAAEAVEAARASVEVAQQSVQLQTEAIQAQTAYAYKMDILETFLGIAKNSPGVINLQKAYIEAYLEQLTMGSELAGGITLSDPFWQPFRMDVCVAWQETRCEDGTPQSKGALMRQFPEIGNLCFPEQAVGDNVCDVNLKN
ncbi:MAG: hypothetical protein Q4P24_16875 [Rhodobacterales bacterium]|nr:hypothetical protein [Rhodobacterales bacterium]